MQVTNGYMQNASRRSVGCGVEHHAVRGIDRFREHSFGLLRGDWPRQGRDENDPAQQSFCWKTPDHPADPPHTEAFVRPGTTPAPRAELVDEDSLGSH